MNRSFNKKVADFGKSVDDFGKSAKDFGKSNNTSMTGILVDSITASFAYNLNISELRMYPTLYKAVSDHKLTATEAAKIIKEIKGR